MEVVILFCTDAIIKEALRVKVNVINEEILGKHLICREQSRDLSM